MCLFSGVGVLTGMKRIDARLPKRRGARRGGSGAEILQHNGGKGFAEFYGAVCVEMARVIKIGRKIKAEGEEELVCIEVVQWNAEALGGIL